MPDLEACVDYGVIVAYMGAPEKMAALQYPVAAELAVQKALEAKGIATEKRVCIVPVEIGPISSVVACLVAARLGIPVLDADGAASKIESLARPILGMPEFNQMAGLAMWVMDREQIQKFVLPGSLSLCQALGELLATQKNLVPAILDFFSNQTYAQGYQAKTVFEGSLRSASSSTQGGFDHGQVEIGLLNGNTGVVVFQNESLILWDSAHTAPWVTAPNLIAYVIPDQAPYVFTNADIMQGNALKPELLGKKKRSWFFKHPKNSPNRKRVYTKNASKSCSRLGRKAPFRATTKANWPNWAIMAAWSPSPSLDSA